MTAKQTALYNTLILIASALATGVVVSLAFNYLTVTQIGIAACAVMLVFGIKMVYNIELDRAKRLEELNKTR